MSQTQLTGDKLLQMDDLLWKWGQFPETSSSATNCLAKKNDLNKSGMTFSYRRENPITELRWNTIWFCIHECFDSVYNVVSKQLIGLPYIDM